MSEVGSNRGYERFFSVKLSRSQPLPPWTPRAQSSPDHRCLSTSPALLLNDMTTTRSAAMGPRDDLAYQELLLVEAPLDRAVARDIHKTQSEDEKATNLRKMWTGAWSHLSTVPTFPLKRSRRPLRRLADPS